MLKYYKPTSITVIPGKTSTQQLIKLNCHLKDLVHGGQLKNALHLFQQTHSSPDPRPDHYTLSTALTACASLHDTVLGSQLHCHSIKNGLKAFSHVTNTLLSLYAKSRDLSSVKRVFDEIENPDVYSRTTLVSACVKLGGVGYARQVFDEMPHRDVAVWNAMITGSMENGDEWDAFDCFRRMRGLGVAGDGYTFASLLSVCSLDMGREVHCLVVKTGFLRRASVINALLSMYFDCGSAADAYRVFEEVGCEVGDVITYNAVIAGLMSLEEYEGALLMFKDMKVTGLVPTELTLVSVMGACKCSGIAGQVHGQAVKIGLGKCTSVNNAAISMYSSCGDLSAACLIFSRLFEKDVVSWNAIISSFAQENLGEEAVSAYIKMQSNGIEPDEFTIGSLLASSELLEVIEMIQAVAIKKALILRVEIANALISAFSRCGEISQAEKLFCNMRSKNLISWNSMISGYQLNGLPAIGLQQFSQMLLLGFRPNHYTLSLTLSNCATISDLKHGREVHSYILKFGYFSHTLLGNALIALYSKCGALDWSLRVFQSMTQKDIVSWNSIISALAQNGEGEEAILLFEAMQRSSGIRPDDTTFTAILLACSHSGLVADGIRFFNMMVNVYSIEPEMHHFSCIVDLLGRAGFLDIAEGLMINSSSMGSEVDPNVWWTLLSCCAAHGHLQLGSIVARFLLETGYYDPAAVYVLLSNLYANAGKWQESADLRELMRKYGVIKQPGSSWVGS